MATSLKLPLSSALQVTLVVLVERFDCISKEIDRCKQMTPATPATPVTPVSSFFVLFRASEARCSCVLYLVAKKSFGP